MMTYETKGTEGTVVILPDDNAPNSVWGNEGVFPFRSHLDALGSFSVFLVYSTTSGSSDDTHIAQIITEETAFEANFAYLTAQWKQETGLHSSVELIAIHPAYQRIIGMGERVVPLILKDLEQSDGQWYWALRAITGESPIPPESRGRVAEMKKAWLEWGRRYGYIA